CPRIAKVQPERIPAQIVPRRGDPHGFVPWKVRATRAHPVANPENASSDRSPSETRAGWRKAAVRRRHWHLPRQTERQCAARLFLRRVRRAGLLRGLLQKVP